MNVAQLLLLLLFFFLRHESCSRAVENEVDVVVHKLVVQVDRPTLAIFINSAIDALSRIFKDLKSILGTRK
jgi:hypothetical protein